MLRSPVQHLPHPIPSQAGHISSLLMTVGSSVGLWGTSWENDGDLPTSGHHNTGVGHVSGTKEANSRLFMPALWENSPSMSCPLPCHNFLFFLSSSHIRCSTQILVTLRTRDLGRYKVFPRKKEISLAKVKDSRHCL